MLGGAGSCQYLLDTAGGHVDRELAAGEVTYDSFCEVYSYKRNACPSTGTLRGLFSFTAFDFAPLAKSWKSRFGRVVFRDHTNKTDG